MLATAKAEEVCIIGIIIRFSYKAIWLIPYGSKRGILDIPSHDTL